MVGQRSRQYFSTRWWLSEGCFKYIRSLYVIVNLTNVYLLARWLFVFGKDGSSAT